MRIACPSCHAEYEVPDAMLAGGARQLRCARCGHGFLGALPAAPAGAPQPKPSLAPPEVAKSAPTPPSEPLATVPPAKPASAEAPSAPVSVAAPKAPEPAPAPASPPGMAASPDRPPPTRGPVQHSPIDAPQDPPPPATGRLAAAWLGSLALVGAGVAALLVFHAEIAAAWPPAARLYVALGLG
jgi:predicted Zn finger-like uncharacterized protein